MGNKRKNQTEIEEETKKMKICETKKENVEICKRVPPHPIWAGNDVCVTRKTHIIAQFKKCKYLLDRKFDFVKIHALGKAINQALCLALKIEEEMHNSISVNILTGTVEVTDDLISLLDADDMNIKQRQVSAVKILSFFRLSLQHLTRTKSTFSTSPAPQIAIIGSGPSGLYVCSRLLQRFENCFIDIFDKAQAPFGLIYYGVSAVMPKCKTGNQAIIFVRNPGPVQGRVAPDHFDMKKSMTGFEKMFEENRERLELFCNVDANKDVNFEELCSSYDAVVLAYGANKPRKLGLENEYGNNCFSGGEFVSWYNGMSQQYIKNIPKLDTGSNAVVIGNGNVAIDCSRILLSSPERLKQTDITENALNALKKSKIKNVYIIGRRGPKE
uniref:FAD/NAD(P)-binding domain-containing protein n=1 Tax=Meloidogyne javanica TaxID=6303 RepID=A0A915N687_MELJA